MMMKLGKPPLRYWKIQMRASLCIANGHPPHFANLELQSGAVSNQCIVFSVSDLTSGSTVRVLYERARHSRRVQLEICVLCPPRRGEVFSNYKTIALCVKFPADWLPACLPTGMVPCFFCHHSRGEGGTDHVFLQIGTCLTFALPQRIHVREGELTPTLSAWLLPATIYREKNGVIDFSLRTGWHVFSQWEPKMRL